ncbi:hypothetical protein BSSX_p0089 (plasmid) [Bacillus subtilis]|nr:hypothetical protein BSSX_p0089 [Bacillus subtilis]
MFEARRSSRSRTDRRPFFLAAPAGLANSYSLCCLVPDHGGRFGPLFLWTRADIWPPYFAKTRLSVSMVARPLERQLLERLKQIFQSKNRNSIL